MSESRACVKCTSVLDKSTVGGVEVDLCPSCGGLWLDAGELEKIGAGADGDVAALKATLTGSATPEPASEETSACPACPGKLKEVLLGTVHIDYCTSCMGLFLDKGELDAALTAAKGYTLKQLLSAVGRVTGQFPVAQQ